MDFDYNTTRNTLILPEYGRNVQNMVAYITSLPNREERNRLAQLVIDLMGFLNPHLRDVADFKHKLWDHLYIISDFKIDVDSPYPKPEKETLHRKPQILGYPQHRIKYKHYGKTVEKMIERANALQDTNLKNQMVLGIANFMKVAYVTWNKDSVADETILSDLKELSNGSLELPANTVLSKVEFKTPPPGSRTKNQNANKNRNHSKGHGNGVNKKKNKRH